MSESKGSFWATIPGLITGIAGLLTGIVGLIAVLNQVGVLGGDDSSSGSAATSTTVVGGARGGASGGGGSTNEAPSFGVTPSTLDFKPADPREKTITVTNESDTASITIGQPRVTGDDPDEFSVSRGDCSRALEPGESCTLRVTFAPSGALRTYEASVQITAPGARAEDVRLTGSTVLG